MTPGTDNGKLASLRSLMSSTSHGEKTGIDAYIVTSSDAHGSEYVQSRDERIAFISGFTGSAGTAVITQDQALLWTDGRYFNQATFELQPPNAWTLMKEEWPGIPSIGEWLSDNLPPGSLIGVDPVYIDESTASDIKSCLIKHQQLVRIEENLVDEVWGSRQPKPTLKEIVPLNYIYTGKSAGHKAKECMQEMERHGTSILVLTALDDIAYLLNCRGTDIPYNPLFLSYAILHSKKLHLFVQKERLTSETKQHLVDEKLDYEVHPYEDVRSYLQKLCSEQKTGVKVWISSRSNWGLHIACGELATYKGLTPPMLMKAVKNEAEIDGMKTAHIKDAIGVIKYLAWLENKVLNYTNSEESYVTELSAALQLENYRQQQENYLGPSFATISGSGRHGAIIHYRSGPETDIPITSKELYLLKTGSQFREGTTVITRTLHFGNPTDFERECFTRVFKGQFNLSSAKFPIGVKGNFLDSKARKYLWEVGLNYLHGTGHGVGAHLNVHEYPPAIHDKDRPDDIGMVPGMFITNQPAYYETGKFGIRLENVELVVKADTEYKRAGIEFCSFETVTVVPIQKKLLNISMLDEEEITFLNNYHQRCLKTLKPYLQGPKHAQALVWLKKETEPIFK